MSDEFDIDAAIKGLEENGEVLSRWEDLTAGLEPPKNPISADPSTEKAELERMYRL